MSRTYKTIVLVVFVLVFLPLILIGSCIVRTKSYESESKLIEKGESKQKVIDGMGKSFEINSCNFVVYDSNKKYVGECFETYTYKSLFEKWTFAFDKNGAVIEKYYSFLGEYGQMLPNSN